MMSIMEEFKVLGLGSEMTIGTKPLPSKESPIIALIEAFHDTITPRFSYRDEYHLDTHDQAESQNDAKGARVAIASTETEFVVELEKIGDSHGLPAADQTQGYGLVVFPSLGIEKNSVARAIDNIERMETPIVLDVPGTQEICLMDVIDPQRLSEIGV
jgi:hypothetical protein